MNEQLQELKETIIELRDKNGTGTQQEVWISRQKILEAIKNYASMLWEKYHEPFPESTIMEIIQALPPVTLQQPKMGRWIVNEWGNISCSECGCTALYDKVYPGESVFGKAIRVKSTFCPTCGVKMQEVEE